MTESHAGYTYPRQATRVIEDLPNEDLPTVLAGDFNASKSEAHLANVRRLNDRGLISAYHARHGLEHDGVEAHPTSYYQWQESRPFHMDFRFVPQSWMIRSVDVGAFADYTDRHLSDHVLVIVSVDP